MLNHNIFKASIFFLANGVAFAGSMGPANTGNDHSMNYFVSAEGLYSWANLGDFFQNGTKINISRQPWGGRVAAGVLKPYKNNVSFSAEMGWGYYGVNRYRDESVGWNKNGTHYGFDLLIGADYKYENFDAFIKVGALLDHLLFVSTQKYDLLFVGGVYRGNMTMGSTQAGILPEIKAGGIYNFTHSLGISLAYLYAFGGSPHGNIIQAAEVGGRTLSTGYQNNEVPSFGALTLGLIYKFS